MSPETQIARLMMQHRTTLYGYIFACLRDHSDSEDVLQLVTIAAMESCHQLRDEKGFLPWAREIARRRVLAHRRSKAKEKPIDPELVQALTDAADRVDKKLPATPQQLALLECLDHLPPNSKLLIMERYDSQSGDAEHLAAKFGNTVQSIYARIKRIKIALRKCVERRIMEESTLDL
ncbi:MAG: sigma-70 family RNA polymerase sigma factor [Zavarzinella sp.]